MTNLDSQKMALNRELAALNADATSLRKYATAKTKTMSDMQVSRWNFDAQLGKFFAGEHAGFIAEVAQETERRNGGAKIAGYQLPIEILAERDLAEGGAGSQLVSPNLTLKKVSDGLRQLDPILSLGVEILEIPSLGNVAVPIETAVTTGQWATENSSQSTQQGTPTFGAATTTNFRRFTAAYDASSQWLKQAQIDGGVLEWLKRDLRRTVAQTISSAVLVGSGGTQPLGIVNRTPGSGSISSVTLSNPTTWQQVCAVDQTVENLSVHALGQDTGWVISPNAKYSWATTPKVPTQNTNDFILEHETKLVNGHRAFATTKVVNGTGSYAIFCSRWNSVLVLIPGTIGITVDSKTQAHRNVTRITIDLLMDVILRRPESIVIANTTF